MAMKDIEKKIGNTVPLYLRPDKVKREIQILFKKYSSFTADLISTMVEENDEIKKLLNVLGLIPIHYNSECKYIPISIIIHDEHPSCPPIIYIKELETLHWEVFDFIEQSGKVNLPYIVNNKNKNTNLIILIKRIINMFHLKIQEKLTRSSNELHNNIYYDPLLNIIININRNDQFCVQYSRTSRILIQEEENGRIRNISISNTSIKIGKALNYLKNKKKISGMNNIKLIFEPATLSIQCANLEFSQNLVSSAYKSDFRESGFTFFNNRFIVTIRSSKTNHSIIPITNKENVQIINEKYLEYMINEINIQILSDHDKLKKFDKVLRKLFYNRKFTQQTISACNSNISSYENDVQIEDGRFYMNLLLLPPEIIQNILSMLTGKTLQYLREVNRSWNKCILENVWMSENAYKKICMKIERNWLNNDFSIYYQNFKIGFQFPEIVATSSKLVVIYQTIQNYETFAIINLIKEEIWVIEENHSKFKSCKFKINNSLFAVYKEKYLDFGYIKVWCLKKRKVILQETFEKFLDLQIDQLSSLLTLVILSKQKLDVIQFEKNNYNMNRFSVNISTNDNPRFSHFCGNIYSYGLNPYNINKTTFQVWKINQEYSFIENLKDIQCLEDYVHKCETKSNFTHNAIHYKNHIIYHGCNQYFYQETCSIRIINASDELLRVIIFNDHYQDCLGDIEFITFDGNFLFLKRKFREEGIYLLRTEEDFLHGPTINISGRRKEALMKYEIGSFFVNQLIHCEYVVGQSFASSVSISNTEYNNKYKCCNINVKTLKFWGHN